MERVGAHHTAELPAVQAPSLGVDGVHKTDTSCDTARGGVAARGSADDDLNDAARTAAAVEAAAAAAAEAAAEAARAKDSVLGRV